MEEINFSVAYLSTGAFVKDDKGILSPSHCINPQLKIWKDAKIEYKEYLKLISTGRIDKKDWTYIHSIVLKLGQSLTDLFGANYEEIGRTPPLKSYIEDIFPARGWNLKVEEPELYERFMKLDQFHKTVNKHYSRAKIAILEETTLNDLRSYMETAREMWLWFMRKKNDGVITLDMKEEFLENYL